MLWGYPLTLLFWRSCPLFDPFLKILILLLGYSLYLGVLCASQEFQWVFQSFYFEEKEEEKKKKKEKKIELFLTLIIIISLLAIGLLLQPYNLIIFCQLILKFKKKKLPANPSLIFNSIFVATESIIPTHETSFFRLAEDSSTSWTLQLYQNVSKGLSQPANPFLSR